VQGRKEDSESYRGRASAIAAAVLEKKWICTRVGRIIAPVDLIGVQSECEPPHKKQFKEAIWLKTNSWNN
jgi:hypothetical protein